MTPPATGLCSGSVPLTGRKIWTSTWNGEHDSHNRRRVPLRAAMGGRDAFRVQPASDLTPTGTSLVGGHEIGCDVGADGADLRLVMSAVARCPRRHLGAPFCGGRLRRCEVSSS